MKITQLLFIGIVIFLAASCSSRKLRKNCEKVDSVYYLCEDV